MSLKLEASGEPAGQVSITMTVRRLAVVRQVAQYALQSCKERQPGCCLIRGRRILSYCDRLLPALV